MNHTFYDYFRCPGSTVDFRLTGKLSPGLGYFQFGGDVTCYGRSSAGDLARNYNSALCDLRSAVQLGEQIVELPFDPDEVATNLRCEFYAGHMGEHKTKLPPNPVFRSIYYVARPHMSVRFRRILQKLFLAGQTTKSFPQWPVDRTVDRLFESLMTLAIQSRNNEPVPFVWFWPEGAQAAAIFTHDVEAEGGKNFCSALMDLDDEFGFKSSFQVVPEKRYEVTGAFLDEFRRRGFEINVHDLNHDGNLFCTREEFTRRAERINHFAQEFGSSGFRSGALYRNLRWYDAFQFSYDMSVPNVAHLDPQNGGCCTILPYFVGKVLEIPVTVTQDYSLFNILNTYSTDLWKEQLKRIVDGHGLISIIVHPDYIVEEKARNSYRQLLGMLAELRDHSGVWAAVPREINNWWRLRRELKIVRKGEDWAIEGQGKERARIAYAQIVDGRLAYTFDPALARQRTRTSIESTDADPLTFHVTPGPNSQGQAVLESEGQAPLEKVAPRTRDLSAPSADSPAVAPRPARRPLRICMIAYSFYETDNRVMRYAETLAQRGDHVDVLALRREDAPIAEVLGGVHLYRLQGREIDEKTRFTYLWRILSFLVRAMVRVSKLHLQQKYDLIHVHSVPDFLVFAAWVPKLMGTPVILDIHDILPEFYTSKFGAGPDSLSFRVLQGVEKSSARFSSHVIIANHIWQQRLVSRSVQAEKCSVIMNSPDRSIFYNHGNPRPAKNRFLLLYPGSINQHQGLDLAIRAFARISDRAPHADFCIYGSGPSQKALSTLIQELHLENRVFIRNPMPLREIAKVIESADLGIVPKRKDTFGNEAFSTKILEFMAMGVPVIVSDTQIDRYYFDDSVVKFFRGGDEEDLARCMLDLIEHPEKRKQLAAEATPFVEKMDWTAKKHEYLDLVDELVPNQE
jgi:glycosyltransferase involved in cell wall biosynthesis